MFYAFAVIASFFFLEDLVLHWSQYLDKHTTHFSAEITTVEYDSETSKILKWNMNHKVVRHGDLWNIQFTRAAANEPFKFGALVAATDDQVCEGYLNFSNPDDPLEKGLHRWSGYMARSTGSDEMISNGLWDLRYVIGFADWDELKATTKLITESKSKDNDTTLITGRLEQDTIKLWFGKHPCPSKMELLQTRKSPNGQNKTIATRIDEIQWQEDADLPTQFRISVTQNAQGTISDRYAIVSIKQLERESLSRDKLKFPIIPKNGTKVNCLDLASQAIFKDGRIVPVEPSRPEIEFTQSSNRGWITVVSLLAITLSALLILRRRFTQ